MLTTPNTMSTERGEYLRSLSATLRSNNDLSGAEILDNALAELERDHWHEFSINLLAAVQDPLILPELHNIYERVLMRVRADISPIAYVKLVYYTCFAPNTSLEQALELVEGGKAMLLSQGAIQCKHALECIRALLLLEHTSEDYHTLTATPGSAPYLVRKVLEEVEAYTKTLPMHEIEPLLLALQCKARGRDYELRKQYTLYYKNAFEIVTYFDKAEMPLIPNEMKDLALKTAIAALLSEGIFNFGKFLNSSVFVSHLRDSSEHAWLLEWMQLCNEGDVAGFERSYEMHSHNNNNNDSSVTSTFPIIAENRHALLRKVRLMALLHLVFYTPFNERVFAFDTISERCSVPVQEAEPLLLTALAQGIIRGKIDGMLKQIHVTWVEPRVLSLLEVKKLASHVAEWRRSVEAIKTSIDNIPTMVE